MSTACGAFLCLRPTSPRKLFLSQVRLLLVLPCGGPHATCTARRSALCIAPIRPRLTPVHAAAAVQRMASRPGASRKRKAAGSVNIVALDVLNCWATSKFVGEDILVFRLAGDASMHGQVWPR